MTRYAIYFAPAPVSPWWQAGCRWLGRDAAHGALCTQPAVAGIPPLMREKLTAHARRYGFHGTLKAPFRLADGFAESHLSAMARAFAELQQPIVLDGVQVRPLDDFLALRAAGPADRIGALAMRCVSYFDMLRAAPAPAELARRRRAGLSPRQEALLQRWGYPYTEEEFRFHMTLTDSLADVDEDAAYALRKAAEECFAPALRTPLAIDAITLFREDEPGQPFMAWQRFPFGASAAEPALPASGRLFFFVGPSGAGKDTLLQWVQQRMPAESRIVFARRTITRPVHSSEAHEPADSATFWQLAAGGHFSLMWQANDLCYGVRRGIEADLKAGHDVVVNGSREYIPRLLQQFPDARVIWIDADPARIKERIVARQRESGAALLRRIDRVTQFAPPDAEAVTRIDNSGPIEVAGQRLLEILLAR